jgi:hypothetical protein
MRRQLQASLIATCGLGMLGCGVAATPQPEAVVAAPVEDHPAPVARIEVDAERAIEFYEYPSGVLAMESGVARDKALLPAFRDKLDAGQLVDIAATLRPDLPPPEALVSLQARMQAAPRTAIDKDRTARPWETELPPATSGYAPIHASGCGNNCCNSTWLVNNLCGDGSFWDYSWFLLDYGWSYENFSSVSRFYGAACAATGTSSFSVDIGDGSGGTWSVQEAHYRTFEWIAGCYLFNCPDHKSADSSVNRQSNQHLHSYCGGVWH